MAGWTQQDADAVRAAILKLVTGQKAVSVTYSPSGGSSRSVTYYQADLADLRALLAEMESSSSGSPGYRLASTNKGF